MQGRTLFIFEVGLAIWVMVLLSICCVYIWPNDEKIASWVQAIGSIGAIVGAAIGIAWQIADNAKRAAEAALAETERQLEASRVEVRNLLKALRSELEAYQTSLKVVKNRMDNSNALKEHGRFSTTFPEMAITFPVYIACAPKLGLIANDKLRSDIIRIFAELGATFAFINLNSQHASRLHDGDQAAQLARETLKKLAPKLKETIENTQTHIDKICGDISNAVM